MATEAVDAIVRDTLYSRPDAGAPCWTTRTMAARHGVGKDTVARVWREHGLRPWEQHRESGPKRGRAAIAATRAGREDDPVLTLLAALNEATGEALARCHPRESHRDFLFFLKLIEAIDLWVEHWNDTAKPFTWHSRGEAEAKVRRGRAALSRHRAPEKPRRA